MLLRPQLPETSIRRASELTINRGHAEDHLADIRVTPMDFFDIMEQTDPNRECPR
jgi:hypothetical protein